MYIHFLASLFFKGYLWQAFKSVIQFCEMVIGFALWPIAHNQIRCSGPQCLAKFTTVAHSAERRQKSNFSANSNLYSKLLQITNQRICWVLLAKSLLTKKSHTSVPLSRYCVITISWEMRGRGELNCVVMLRSMQIVADVGCYGGDVENYEGYGWGVTGDIEPSGSCGRCFQSSAEQGTASIVC